MSQKVNQLINNQSFRDKLKIILLLVWLAIIYFFSTLPGGGTPADFLTGVARKIAHLVEFALLMFLFYKVLRLSFKETFSQAVLIGIACSVLYAMSDEFHQLFVAGRFGTFRDVIIDSFGILVMAGLIYLEHEHQLNFPHKRHIVKI